MRKFAAILLALNGLVSLYLQRGGDLPFVPPVSEGPRHVVILHETEDLTPAFSRLVTDLRVGEFAQYAKAKGHTLDILDDDTPDRPIVQQLASQGVPLPALFILDADDDPVLAKQPAPEFGADVLAVLKANGG